MKEIVRSSDTVCEIKSTQNEAKFTPTSRASAQMRLNSEKHWKKWKQREAGHTERGSKKALFDTRALPRADILNNTTAAEYAAPIRAPGSSFFRCLQIINLAASPKDHCTFLVLFPEVSRIFFYLIFMSLYKFYKITTALKITIIKIIFIINNFQNFFFSK